MTGSSAHVRRFLGLLGWVLLVPSVLTALASAWMLASGLGMLGGTHTATGRVVAHHDLSTGPAHRRGLSRQSVVEFTASDGRIHRFTDAVARQGHAVHKIGETVTVRYHAADPVRAEIGGSTAVKVLGGGAMLVFSGLGVLAGWLLVRLRRRAGDAAASHGPD